MAKAIEAFRTISEVAEELDVQKHVLRFWENKFPQVRPMKRGGGRRYYRPDDLDLLRGIRFLLHRERYTIKGVQKILREQGLDHVKSCWQVALPKPAPAVSALQPPTPARKPRPGQAGDLAIVIGKDSHSKDKAALPQVVGTKLGGKAAETLKLLRALAAELEQCRRILRGEEGSRDTPKRGSPPRSARAGR